MATNYSITDFFGANLAALLASKISLVYPHFDSNGFEMTVKQLVQGRSYTERIAVIAKQLQRFLPADYGTSVPILMEILGEENPRETGMFTDFYWVMPIGKYIGEYGLEHFELSMQAIEEITKRNTGEYAVRPFIKQYPDRTLTVMDRWARSSNFHLRRLASEGLRPKLPWAPKLETFIDNPQPVFSILELLKSDEIMFVKRSVANHLTDWLKVNYEMASTLMSEWIKSNNIHTQWIVRRATRKIQ